MERAERQPLDKGSRYCFPHVTWFRCTLARLRGSKHRQLQLSFQKHVLCWAKYSGGME